MNQRIYIGIDAGTHTGFAVWNGTHQKFELVKTYDFWDCILNLGHIVKRILTDHDEVIIVIEDVTQNKSAYSALKTYSKTEGGHKNKLLAALEHAKRVGTVWDKTKLITEWCQRNKLKMLLIKPTNKTMTKIKSEEFKRITNYDGQTSEHSRDACFLVFKRK
jgi:hypothetical protein